MASLPTEAEVECRKAAMLARVAEAAQAELVNAREMPYDEYLQTDHWKIVRKQALGRALYRCQVCNADQKRLDVHHRTYERLGREKPEDLTVLCCDCHKTFHESEASQ